MASLFVRGSSKLFVTSRSSVMFNSHPFSNTSKLGAQQGTKKSNPQHQQKPATEAPPNKVETSAVPPSGSGTAPPFSEPTKLNIPKAPIRLYGLTGEYATCLFDNAAKYQVLDVVERELQLLKYCAANSAVIKKLLTNPVLPQSTRIKGIDVLTSQGGYTFSAVTTGFLYLLTQNKRISYCFSIIDEYGKLMKANKNEVDGFITSAKPLDNDEVDAIKKDIRYKYFKTDTKLNISFKVDPSIQGGIKIDVGQVHVDQSVAAELERIKKGVTDAVKQFFSKKLADRPK